MISPVLLDGLFEYRECMMRDLLRGCRGCRLRYGEQTLGTAIRSRFSMAAHRIWVMRTPILRIVQTDARRYREAPDELITVNKVAP